MTNRLLSRYARDDSEFDRAIAFIDATFAVALTLLVTTLDIASDSSGWDSLSDAYDAMGSQILAFAISFVVISSYWLLHYRLFSTFSSIDVRLIVVNLFLLAAIVLLPFTTESVVNPDINDLPLPTAVLAVNVAAISIAFTAIYVMAPKRGLLQSAPPTNRALTWNAVMYLAPAAVFLASIPIAYASEPYVAQLSWLSLLVINPVLGAVSARDLRAHGVEAGDG